MTERYAQDGRGDRPGGEGQPPGISATTDWRVVARLLDEQETGDR